ncbi:uncharacterized protein EDB91DRAFT_1080577 [Suillus paluster]|uniref:uncharacterized protein n=1 Tax=Suillus paluster TaxID=48578 RepID=UPI001B885E93|nr:uncharacterized protein EDB91DRAFT_1080577 [Suillus paluster]KAG1745072.1 hypothetical protein EDB91DRAFT_1080577 [Suillus paluster]
MFRHRQHQDKLDPSTRLLQYMRFDSDDRSVATGRSRYPDMIKDNLRSAVVTVPNCSFNEAAEELRLAHRIQDYTRRRLHARQLENKRRTPKRSCTIKCDRIADAIRLTWDAPKRLLQILNIQDLLCIRRRKTDIHVIEICPIHQHACTRSPSWSPMHMKHLDRTEAFGVHGIRLLVVLLQVLQPRNLLPAADHRLQQCNRELHDEVALGYELEHGDTGPLAKIMAVGWYAEKDQDDLHTRRIAVRGSHCIIIPLAHGGRYVRILAGAFIKLQ